MCIPDSCIPVFLCPIFLLEVDGIPSMNARQVRKHIKEDDSDPLMMHNYNGIVDPKRMYVQIGPIPNKDFESRI